MSSVKRAGPLRLVATLASAGFISGMILVTVFLATQPLILRNRAEAMERAIYRVLPGSSERKVFIVREGRLEPFGEDLAAAVALDNVVFGAYDETDRLVGYAIPSEGPGFQDTIKLLYGYDPAANLIRGMEVLESRETPGLGDKIIHDGNFLANFDGLAVEPEVVAVPPGTRSKPNEVDTISGATISAQAVVNIINRGNRRFLPAISATEESEGDPQ
jgi:Na+-translocating ferredoxin:NAD+ oxidoreductase subunit G